MIVRLQKIEYKEKNNEKIYQWGKNLAFFIDSLLLEGRYYTPYRFAGNLTPRNEEPLSYYLTIPGIFDILKIRYLLLSNEKVLNMLEEENLIVNYFDNISYKEAIDYVKNKPENDIDQTMNSNTSSTHNNDGHFVSIQLRSFMENLQKP